LFQFNNKRVRVLRVVRVRRFRVFRARVFSRANFRAQTFAREMPSLSTYYNPDWCHPLFRQIFIDEKNARLMHAPVNPRVRVPAVDEYGSTNIGFQPDGAKLTRCLFVNVTNKHNALTIGGKGDGQKWQFKPEYNEHGRRKVIAQRCYFLENEHFTDEMTVSHLCHRASCMNPYHMTFEPLATNKGRNGCAGGSCCQHEVTCLMPGPQIYWEGYEFDGTEDWD